MAAGENSQSRPREASQKVLVAFRADRFLVEVNSGGFLGFFDWEREAAPETVADLRVIGLPDVADSLSSAIHMVAPGQWPRTKAEFAVAKEALMKDDTRRASVDALDQKVIAESAKIEAATHDYIRRHLTVFESLDR